MSAQELLTGEDMAMDDDDDEADDDGADDMDEDEAMAQALAMSMEGAGHADDAPPAAQPLSTKGAPLGRLTGGMAAVKGTSTGASKSGLSPPQYTAVNVW